MNKFKNKLVVFLTTFIVLYSVTQNYGYSVQAQTLGLSIAPPIDEVMIIPGKEVTQTFTITNDGNDGLASIYIIPFRAQGENGNVALDEKNAITASSPYASWFSLVAPVTSFGEKFYMSGGQRQNISIKITPAADATEKDYYFTLLYELDNNVPGNISPTGPTNQARIGANLLISLSKDGSPKKNLNIVEFSAPKVIDSLGKLSFNIRVGNFGSYVFKSNGTLVIKPTFGSSETLTVAPLNVISDSIRNIPCLNGEETIACQSKNKVLIGIYKSTLKITADGDAPSQEKTVTTVAFPFSVTLVLVFIIATYKIIKNSGQNAKNTNNKGKDPLDKENLGSNNRS